MTVVQNVATRPGGGIKANRSVFITLLVPNGVGYTTAADISGTDIIYTDNSGAWSANFVPNDQITPANTVYQVNEDGAISLIVVPDSGGPYNLTQLLVTNPPTPALPGITGIEVAGNGAVAGVRPEINLIAGTNVTVTAADNPSSDRVDVTISSTGGGAVTSVNGHVGAVVLAASDVSAVPTSAEGVASGVATLDSSGHLVSGQDANLVKTSQLGAANGVATLDSNAALPASQGANLFSRQILIQADGAASTKIATVGTWTPTYYGITQFYGWVNQSDGTQNDSITFDFACGAGTYTIELLHLPFQNRGIYTVQIDTVTVGTVDGYASSLAPARGTITGVAIGAGQHTLTVLMAAKNASSSSYVALIERFVLTRTS